MRVRVDWAVPVTAVDALVHASADLPVARVCAADLSCTDCQTTMPPPGGAHAGRQPRQPQPRMRQEDRDPSCEISHKALRCERAMVTVVQRISCLSTIRGYRQSSKYR